MTTLRRPKYAAATAGFTPAASATDIALIGGFDSQGSGLVLVRELRVFGVQTTAGNVELEVIRRAVANTGGTAVAATKGPIDPLDTRVSQAVVQHYTANPTIDTTGSVKVWGGRVLVPAAASVVDGLILRLNFCELFGEGVPLRRAADQLVINLGGATPTGAASFRLFAAWEEWG